MTKKMTINDVAQLLRITPETIRFYEKKKIVTPERNEDNSYRYFTQVDIRRLYDVRIYQSMGFSLAEIIALFKEASPERLDEMIQMKEKELQRIIKEDMQALERIKLVKAANATAEHYYGECYIKDSPNYMISLHSKNGEMIPEAIQHPFWKCVADYYNLFTCAAYIPLDLITDPALSEKMGCGFTVDVEMAEKLGIHVGGPVWEMTPRKCVYTTFHAEPVVSAQSLVPALEWMNQRNLVPTDTILCSTLKITFRDGEESRLYEAWIPID